MYDTFNNPTPGALISNDPGNQIVYARYTYWGTHQSNEFSGPVDTLYPLGSSVFTPSIAAPIFTGAEISGSRRVSEHQKMVNWLRQLRSNIEDDKQDAIDDLHVLGLYLGPGGTKYKDVMDMSWEQFVASVENRSRVVSVRTIASAMRIQARLDRGDFTSVLAMSDALLDRGIDGPLWLFCETRKIFAASAMGDMNSANAILSSIRDHAMTIDSSAVTSMTEYLAHAVPVVSSAAAGHDGEAGNGENSNSTIPKSSELNQNFPNPFNPVTSISYYLSASTHVSLKVFNTLGQVVATPVDRVENVGNHVVRFDASRLASGLYFYRLQTGLYTAVKKMMLIK